MREFKFVTKFSKGPPDQRESKFRTRVSAPGGPKGMAREPDQ